MRGIIRNARAKWNTSNAQVHVGVSQHLSDLATLSLEMGGVCVGTGKVTSPDHSGEDLPLSTIQERGSWVVGAQSIRIAATVAGLFRER